MSRSTKAILLATFVAGAWSSACDAFGDGTSPSTSDAGGGGDDAAIGADAGGDAIVDAPIEGSVDAGPKGDGSCSTLFPTLDFASGSAPPMWTATAPTGGTNTFQGSFSSAVGNGSGMSSARAFISRSAAVPSTGVLRVSYELQMFLQNGDYHEPGCSVAFGFGGDYVHIRFESDPFVFQLGSSTNGNFSSPDFVLPIPSTTATFIVDLRYAVGATSIKVTGNVAATAVTHEVPSPPNFVPNTFTIQCGIPYAEEGNFGTTIDDIAVSQCEAS